MSPKVMASYLYVPLSKHEQDLIKLNINFLTFVVAVVVGLEAGGGGVQQFNTLHYTHTACTTFKIKLRSL